MAGDSSHPPRRGIMNNTSKHLPLLIELCRSDLTNPGVRRKKTCMSHSFVQIWPDHQPLRTSPHGRRLLPSSAPWDHEQHLEASALAHRIVSERSDEPRCPAQENVYVSYPEAQKYSGLRNRSKAFQILPQQ